MKLRQSFLREVHQRAANHLVVVVSAIDDDIAAIYDYYYNYLSALNNSQVFEILQKV